MLHAWSHGEGELVDTFTLNLQSATKVQVISDVAVFVGEDKSGSFSVLANHARMMTILTVGLARFRVNDQWRYIALPGAVMYFHVNTLILNTRTFLIDDDYTRISEALKNQLLAEENALLGMKESLRTMEDSVLKSLWKMGRERGVQSV